MRVTEPGVITHQFMIHRIFHSRSNYRIEKIQSYEYGEDEYHEGTATIHPATRDPRTWRGGVGSGGNLYADPAAISVYADKT